MLQRLHVEDETGEVVLAANLYLRKKSDKTGLVGSKIERQVWSPECIDCQERRANRMNVEHGREILPKADKVPERAHHDFQFREWLSIMTGNS